MGEFEMSKELPPCSGRAAPSTCPFDADTDGTVMIGLRGVDDQRSPLVLRLETLSSFNRNWAVAEVQVRRRKSQYRALVTRCSNHRGDELATWSLDATRSALTRLSTSEPKRPRRCFPKGPLVP